MRIFKMKPSYGVLNNDVTCLEILIRLSAQTLILIFFEKLGFGCKMINAGKKKKKTG